MSDKKVNYILNTVGINIPGYARKDLKVGMSVVLTENTGDGFVKRGFLTKASKVESKDDKASGVLKREIEALKISAEALKTESETLTAENEALKAEIEVLKKAK